MRSSNGSARRSARSAASAASSAFTSSAPASAGTRRYVDVHLQFAAGTTLEDAHATAHELTDAIREHLAGADILVHVEPRDRVEPGTEF